MENKIVGSLITFAAIIAFQLVHDRLYRPAQIDSSGWYWLRPGFIHYFTLIGCAAFAGFMWWVYLFIGSARPDAATQEVAMLLLAVAMTAGAAYVWFACFLRRYAWAEDTFKVHLFNCVKTFDFSKLADINFKHNGQTVVLSFSDGKRISFSADMHGAGDLADHIDRKIF